MWHLYTKTENIQNSSKDIGHHKRLKYFTFILQKAEQYIMNVDIHLSFTKEKGETLFMHALQDATLKPLIH